MLLTKPAFFSLLFMGTLAEKKQDTPHHDFVLFHPDLKAIPTIAFMDNYSTHITR